MEKFFEEAASSKKSVIRKDRHRAVLPWLLIGIKDGGQQAGVVYTTDTNAFQTFKAF